MFLITVSILSHFKAAILMLYMNAVDFNILLVNFIYSKAKGENCFNAEQGKR